MNSFCKRHLPAVFMILLAGIIVYANTFHVPFVFDDTLSITKNPVIERLENFYANRTGYDFLPNRYVAFLTFALNYHFGGLNVAGYHAVNLLIHLSAAVLVYALLVLTFLTPYFREGAEITDAGTMPSSSLTPPAFIPLLAALLFVVHPMQTQAVTYVVQRITSLATLFYLLSVVLYVMARLRLEAGVEKKGSLPSSRVLLPYGGAVLAAVLAMKTKEIAFTLPLIVVLYEVCFFHGPWRRRVLYPLPLLATLPIVPVTLLTTAQPTGGILADIGSQMRVQSVLSRLDYLLTQFRVIATYLRLLIFPADQNLDYDYPVYTRFFTPPVLLSFLLLATLFALALYLWFASRKKPGVSRLVAFGIFWFFIALSVESSIIPITDVIVEHRLYLPSFGAASALASAFWLLGRKFRGPFRNRLLILGGAIAVLGLGIASFNRNHVWGDRIRLWEDVAAKSPGKARPFNNLGEALNDAGRVPEAIKVLSRAIELDPMQPHAYNNLGVSYIMCGLSGAAVPLLKKAIDLDLNYEDAYINLALALNQLRRFHETVTLLEQNLGRVGDRVEAHYHLGVAYAFLGNREAARRKLAIVSPVNASLAADLVRLLK